MHFWIDKRSQACGFGRARVAASLSGTGSGVGLGFAHPPRRIGGKPTIMAPSVHRSQSSNGDNARPHIHQNNNHPANHQSNNNHPLHAANAANNASRGNRTHRSSSSGNHHHPNSSNSASSNNNHHHVITHHDIRNYHHHPQFGSALSAASSGRHYHSTAAATVVACENGCNTAHGHHNHIQRANHHVTVNSINNPNCQQVAVPLPHIYGGPSHSQDLEQGPLGIGPMPTRPNLHGIGSSVANGMIESADSQLLPAHLKCGMWASLVLASVFVAGAKFYFDHQGTGLEVLIFCAFSATFFLAACAVSLCRMPRELAASPSPSVEDHTRSLLTSGLNQHQLYAQTDQRLIEMSQQHAAATAAPPPYHIAILLPENSKEVLPPDETPPPSYDKILI